MHVVWNVYETISHGSGLGAWGGGGRQARVVGTTLS